MFGKMIATLINNKQMTIETQTQTICLATVEKEKNDEYFVASLEKLDKLYLANKLLNSDLDIGKLMAITYKQTSIGSPSNVYMSLMYLQTILKLGAEQCSINDNWYKYSIPQPPDGHSWKRSTGFHPSDGHTVPYTPSLPYKVIMILEQLVNSLQDTWYYKNDSDSIYNWKSDFDATKIFEISIFSPSPFLGMRDESREQSRAIRADPLLIAKITLNKKEYYFRLATWDLGEDISHNH
jgi:hypothetical protein